MDLNVLTHRADDDDIEKRFKGLQQAIRPSPDEMTAHA
jgi:hypothetical protein